MSKSNCRFVSFLYRGAMKKPAVSADMLHILFFAFESQICNRIQNVSYVIEYGNQVAYVYICSVLLCLTRFWRHTTIDRFWNSKQLFISTTLLKRIILHLDGK